MRSVLPAVLAAALWSCDAAAPTATGDWYDLGLHGHWVRVVVEHDGSLYAGTTAGLFTRRLDSPDTSWIGLGLSTRRIRAVLPLSATVLLAAVDITGMDGDTISLFRTTNAGLTWEPYQRNAGDGEGANEIHGLIRLPTGDLAAASTNAVLLSSDDGGSWRRVRAADGTLFQTFLHADPHWPRTLWYFGENGFFQPFVAVSGNLGESWVTVLTSGTGDNAHYSIAVHPTDSTLVYSGMEGRIVRSHDGGRTWQTVFEPTGYPYIHGLVLSAENPSHVIAAGARNASEEEHVVVHISADGGTTWSTRERPDSRGGVYAMLRRIESEGETLYLGTRHGLVRLRP